MVSFPVWSRMTQQALVLVATAFLLMGSGASVSQAQFSSSFEKTPASNRYLITRRVFELPLKLDRTLIPKLKEVCLYCKEGEGNWKCLARATPKTSSFAIEVPRDGEYALQLVTVDHMGKNIPADLNKATPIIVIVDTRQIPTESVALSNPARPDTSVPSPADSDITLVSATIPETTTNSPVPTPLVLSMPPIRDSSAALQVANANETHNPRKRQYMNSPRIGLDYTIDKIGPSGVSKIDVYVTSDQIPDWKLLTTIDDPRSHSEVQLPGEGVFGIRLAATNGNGFGDNVPGPTDLPTAVFEIDLTGPELKVDIDPVIKNATMDIHWQVNDKNLSPEPIEIFYAVQSGSPWQPVAKVKNDGVYHWTLSRTMPTHFLIRVEAHDLAGNVTRMDCANPIPLDLTGPVVNLVGLTPVPVQTATSVSGR